MGCTMSQEDLEDIKLDDRQLKCIDLIAEGGFGRIFLCKDDTKKSYAVKKMMSTNEKEEKRIRLECDVLTELKDKSNIVELLGEDHKENIHFMIFPYYDDGTVADKLSRLKEKNMFMTVTEIVKLFLELCEAVHHIHSIGYAHMDLKPANFLLTKDGELLLTDFGSVEKMPVEISDSRTRQIMVDEVGERCSMPYRAPELFSLDVSSRLDTSVDLWSMGCCLYAFCYLESPFDVVYAKGNSIALAVQSPDKISYDDRFDHKLLDVIKCLLKVEPEKRISIPEIKFSLMDLEPVEQATVHA